MLNSPNRISRFTFLFVFVVMAGTSFVRNEVFQGTTNVINWDGYGYYAYLPGAFIYGDVEEYAFAEEHFENYDVSGDIYQLMEAEDGGRFPIYNIGLAVIWTPSFLVTHGIVSATGIAPADGMSYPYQLMVLLMGLLFAFLGLLYLKRFLALHFSDRVVAITLLAVGLGTNIFYYIVEKPDMTHGYLFALFAIFLYRFSSFICVEDVRHMALSRYLAANKDGRHAQGSKPVAFFQQYGPVISKSIGLGLIVGLMCLVRSSEIVVFAIPAFYGLRNWATLKRNFWYTLPIFITALAVFSIQLIYYKVGTGSWWQNGYAGLGFDWLAPHLFDGLFSYRRGWLVYTPIMIFAFIGLFRLPKRWILPVAIFILGNVYLLFSWHIWWYGNTFGSRPVTQSYALLALPLAAFIAWIMNAKKDSDAFDPDDLDTVDWDALDFDNEGEAAGAEKVESTLSPSPSPEERGDGSDGEKLIFDGKKARFRLIFVPLLIIPFILLNLFQHWQYNQRIIPLDFTNGTYYWHVFGKTKLDKKDRVYLDTDEKIPAGGYTVNVLQWIDTTITVAPKASREFTNLLEHKITAKEAREGSWLSTKLRFSYYGETYDKWKFPSVVTEYRRGSENLKWVQVKIPPTMDTPELDSLHFNLSLPDLQEGDIVKQYLWNLCQDSMLVRGYTSELLTARPNPE